MNDLLQMFFMKEQFCNKSFGKTLVEKPSKTRHQGQLVFLHGGKRDFTPDSLINKLTFKYASVIQLEV